MPSGSNEVKIWRQWSMFVLMGCCGWVVILGIACIEICWRLANWKRFPSVKSGVWVARAGTWQPRSPQEAKWVTSHG